MAVVVLLSALIFPKPKGIFSKVRLRCLQLLRGVFALVGVFFILWSLQPLPVFLQKMTPASKVFLNTPPPMVIAYQNVNIGNQYPEKIIKELMGSDLNASQTSAQAPDIVALVEASGANWQQALNQLDSHYPTHCGVDEPSPFAMQVYAKDAQATCEIIELQGFSLAKLILPTNFGLSKQLSNQLSDQTSSDQPAIPSTSQSARIIYVAHPPPPISSHMAQAQNAILMN